MEEKKEKRKNFWLRLWKLLKPSQKQIKKLLLLTVIFEMARLVGPYILKLIIDKLIVFEVSEIMPIISLIILMLVSESSIRLSTSSFDKSKCPCIRPNQ